MAIVCRLQAGSVFQMDRKAVLSTALTKSIYMASVMAGHGKEAVGLILNEFPVQDH